MRLPPGQRDEVSKRGPGLGGDRLDDAAKFAARPMRLRSRPDDDLSG
jgi:hypothetical protein